LSGQFLQGTLFTAVDAIPGAIVRHTLTLKCNELGKFLQLFFTASKILKMYVVQRFELFPIILYCNFFDFACNFLLQFLSSITQNVKV